MKLFYTRYNHPRCPMNIYATENALVYCDFGNNAESWIKKRFKCYEVVLEDTELLVKTKTQLDEYFDGTRKDFDVPYELHGSEFQIRDWHALTTIGYGKTATYGEIAAQIGSGPRAVGNANHHNPISIIVPCHRVIGANSKLVGYGGGLELKEFLLNHEKAYM